jgi:FkbM family methyltransferase
MITKLAKFIKRKTKYPLKRIAKSVLKNHVYVAKHGLAKGFRVTGDLGFLRRPAPTYEDRFLMSLDLAGKTVYDIGAHIGIMTLFFSKAVGETGQVISFEPNPETFAILRKNVGMNDLTNVRLVNFGLGGKRETLPIVFGEFEGGLGTMDEALQEQLLSNKRGIKTKTVLVEIYPLDEYILADSLPDPDFVKIDVEGYECNVLLGMQETLRRRKPSLFVEIHGADNAQKLEHLGKVVRLLTSHNYEIQEITSGQRILESNIGPSLKGRMLICR